MSYWLGIDVGTTFTAAAICRLQPDQRTHLEVVPLGSRTDAMRSVVYLDGDGEVVAGEMAERRGAADPDRMVREFVQTIPDDVTMVINGVEYSAAALTASVVKWVVDRVAQRENGPAQGITVAYPANWEPGTIGALADALGAAGLPQVSFCTGAQAAAMSYSIREGIGCGGTIAVYDLGGASFDAAVVRTTGATTPAILGIPEGIDGLGGTDFDDAVFGHVLAAVPALSEEEPDATARLRRSFALCRRECIEAKETLSVQTQVTIPVLLPHVQSQVSLTRADFEDLIFPQLADTVQALERTLASAGVAPVDLDGVLVIGGSSRIPLVAQMLAAKLGRPVAVDPDAQTAVALGAALSALPTGTVQIDDATEVDVDPAIPVPAPVAKANSQNPEPAAQALSHEPPWLTAAAQDLDSPDAHWRRASSERLARFAAAGVFALVLAGGAVSAPFIMTSYREPSPAPAEILAPQSPAASVAPALPPPTFHPPAPQLPALAPPGFQPPAFPAPPLQPPAAPAPPVAVVPAPNPSNGAGSTTPAAPSKPPSSTARSKGAAVPAPQHTAKAPAPSPPPDAPQVPDWVNQARS
jgi:actin-like ATPase involved in cell morphogenesis